MFLWAKNIQEKNSTPNYVTFILMKTLLLNFTHHRHILFFFLRLPISAHSLPPQRESSNTEKKECSASSPPPMAPAACCRRRRRRRLILPSPPVDLSSDHTIALLSSPPLLSPLLPPPPPPPPLLRLYRHLPPRQAIPGSTGPSRYNTFVLAFPTLQL